MVNPFLCDSEDDVRRASMSPAQLRIEALEEGDDDALESFTAYLEARGLMPEIVHEWAASNHHCLEEWAKASVWADEVVAGEEKAERLGLM